MDRHYNVGMYLRISVEDAVNCSKRGKANPFRSESASVENQRIILMEYIRLRGWNLADIYTDDGFSGGNFNRPAFQKMVKDAEAGLIDLILVKDLSRLGRDNIEVDYYVEDVFPSMGVRFIALMDNIDSEGDYDVLPFRSLLNDYHLKDLSRKIKSVLHAKAKAGVYVGGFAPYGYKKNPASHGRLMVDPYAAEVVCRIFDLRLRRLGYAKIAAALNADGIPAPRAYYYVSEGKPNPFNVAGLWRDRMVKLILNNEVYLGHSIKMKKRTLSYKNNRLVDRQRDEWIRADNTHEPIISQKIWDSVQSIDLNKYVSGVNKGAERSLFAGMLFCDNGHHMCCNTGIKRRNGEVKKYRSYSCSLHKQTGGAVCSGHTISEPALLQIVRLEIKRQLELAEADENRIVAEIRNNLIKLFEGEKKELHRLSVKLEKVGERAAKLYEDRLDEIINLDTFKSLSANIEAERAQLQIKRDRFTDSMKATGQLLFNIDRWLTEIREFLSMETPDRDTISELIEKIVIGEGEVNSSKKERRQSVAIYYRFVGFCGLV